MSQTDPNINFAQLDLPGDEEQPPSRWLKLREMVRRRKLAVAVVGGSAALAMSGTWLLTLNDSPAPEELWKLAIELIDQVDDVGARDQARLIATRLEEQGYRQPGFAGGLEFVAGIVAFRDAQESESLGSGPLYRRAAALLLEAERQSLVTERRPEWSYALGLSLAHSGRPTRAVGYLRESIKTYPPGRGQAVVAWAAIALDLRQADQLNACLPWLSQVVENRQLDASELDRALLLKARVHLQLDQPDLADAALEGLSEHAARSQAAVIVHAQALMARRSYRQAIEMLKPLSDKGGLDQSHVREALYLMGVCAESLHETDLAISCYRRTSRTFPQSDEALAAELRSAELLRRSERTEEALNAYGEALGRVAQSAEFYNHWLTADQFREQVEAAWNAWIARQEFHEAIALARMMRPLFDETVAARAEAVANEEWVLSLQREYDAATVSVRESLAAELRHRWGASGAAFARLAETLDEKNADALWTSADHFRRGNDLQNSLVQITHFLNGPATSRTPIALIMRGEILMDLDRLDEALVHFQEVLAKHPKNEAAFEARYVIGRCYFEQNRMEEAEKAWRDVLQSRIITPQAAEWRASLLALGRLLYHTADLARHRYEGQAAAGDTTANPALLNAAYDRWEESIARLEEFLKRYPQDPDAIEARYLLAKSLQQSASRSTYELTRAETDNARDQLHRERRRHLTAAIAELRTLQTELGLLHEADRLEPLGRQLLQNCYFEIAHTYYALEDYERAIHTYQVAANRFPQTASVLLAYVQMTNCYDRLDQPGNARSMLEQASVILEGMPDDVFTSGMTNLSKDDWKTWLEWAKAFKRDGNLMLTGGA